MHLIICGVSHAGAHIGCCTVQACLVTTGMILKFLFLILRCLCTLHLHALLVIFLVCLSLQYLASDADIHRRVRTSSVQQTAVAMEGQTTAHIVHRLHGFVLHPTSLDFGLLQEGCTYHMAFSLLNTGVDMGRFKIKQPPPATGMTVLYTRMAVGH